MTDFVINNLYSVRQIREMTKSDVSTCYWVLLQNPLNETVKTKIRGMNDLDPRISANRVDDYLFRCVLPASKTSQQQTFEYAGTEQNFRKWMSVEVLLTLEQTNDRPVGLHVRPKGVQVKQPYLLFGDRLFGYGKIYSCHPKIVKAYNLSKENITR